MATVRSNALALAALVALVSAPSALAQVSKKRPPSRSACEKKIAAYFALPRSAPNFAQSETALFGELARVPPLRARDAASWRKKLPKFHKKLRKLGKSGKQWFWEKQKRGLYYVAAPKKPKGLLIGLHGGGKGSGDASSSFGAYRAAAKRFGLALVCPEVLVKSELGWTTDGTEGFVMQLIDCALRTWKIDADRVYVAGHSMGGYGSWTLGARHADRLAGVAPSAGAPTPIFDARDRKTIIDIQSGVIPSLRNLRMMIFQSTDDPRVPPGPNQCAVRLLREAKERWGGYDFEYLEVDDRGHGFPRGGPEVLLQKIVSHERRVLPERITWQPAHADKRQFYWLWWDKPVPEAIIVADLDRKKRRVAITCTKGGREFEAQGLRVLLDGRITDLSKDFEVTINGASVFRSVPQRALEVIARSGRHPDDALVFEAAAPAFSQPAR